MTLDQLVFRCQELLNKGVAPDTPVEVGTDWGTSPAKSVTLNFDDEEEGVSVLIDSQG